MFHPQQKSSLSRFGILRDTALDAFAAGHHLPGFTSVSSSGCTTVLLSK